MATEYKPVDWKADEIVSSFYSGSKVTELGRASVNIMKGRNSRKWSITGFSVRSSDRNSYKDWEGRWTSDTAHIPEDLGWETTLRDAKFCAEMWINNQVCMNSLKDEVMVDAE